MTMHGAAPVPPRRGYCADCGAPVTGPYCGACGQAFPTHRLSLRHLAFEVPHAIFHFDHGVLPTLYRLAVRPGITINAYLNGRRKRLTNPLTLLLLTTGLYALLSIMALPPVADASASAVEDARTFPRAFIEHALLTFAAQLPLTALTTWALFRGDRRTYGEHLAIHAYIWAFTAFLGAGVIALSPALDRDLYLIALYVPNIAYQIGAMYGVFRAGTRHRGLRLVKTVVAFALYTALNTATLHAAAKGYTALSG